MKKETTQYKKKIDPVMDVFIKEEPGRYEQLIIKYNYINSAKKLMGFELIPCQGRHDGEGFTKTSKEDWDNSLELYNEYLKGAQAWV